MPNKKDFFDELESESEEAVKWPPVWFVSYSDLTSLLLTFFIFFFSVSSLDELPKVLKILRQESNVIIPIEKSELPFPEKTTPGGKGYLKNESGVIDKFRKYLESAGLEKDVTLQTGAKEIKVTISNPILFDSGKSELKPKALPILNKLAELFKDSNSYIRVEGHTDNLPIHNDKFPSNWELSSSRAIGVIKHFINNSDISPTRFEALGYGEFRPADQNDTEEGRAKNRRVEIKILQK